MKNLITAEAIQAGSLVSSLDLLEDINFFREEEGNRVKLKHKDLLTKIRKEWIIYSKIYGYNSDILEKSNERNISLVSEARSGAIKQVFFEMSKSFSLHMLSSESSFVRASIQRRWEELELKTQEKPKELTVEEILLLNQSTIQKLSAKNKALEIEARQAKEAITQGNDISVDDAALITQSEYRLGRNKLYMLLRLCGAFREKGDNMPYITHLESGKFRVIRVDTKVGAVNKVLLTPKGYNKLSSILSTMKSTGALDRYKEWYTSVYQKWTKDSRRDQVNHMLHYREEWLPTVPKF